MNQFRKGIIFLGVLSMMGGLVSCDWFDDTPSTSITASMVKDKESLKNFVLQAKNHLEVDYEKAIEDFKTDEEWIKGSTYLFILTMEGVSVFHPTSPQLQGKSQIDLKDSNGTLIVKGLIESAKSGKFVEYLWDNPGTDSKEPSQKISYALPFKRDGKDFIIGSGFYVNP